MIWNVKFILFWTFCWAMGTAVCLVIQGSYFDSQNALVNTLTGFSIANYQTLTITDYFQMGIGFFTTGIPTLLLWNYTFLQAPGFDTFRFFLIAILDPGLVLAFYLLAKQILPI